MSEGPQSLRGLFSKAERAREELSSSYETNSPTYQENLSATIATYEECLKISEQVSLFSPNETLEDISSSDLQYVYYFNGRFQENVFTARDPAYVFTRYMAINYHMAELVQKIFNTDISARKQNLIRARGHYEQFLKLLDAYDVLGKADAKLFEVYAEDKDNFSTASTKDAAARRDAKIARFREEKQLKQKLEVGIGIPITRTKHQG